MFGAQLRCDKCNQYKPDRCKCPPKDPQLKGVKGGNCNREACQEPGATFFNKSTRKYYCAACAKEINWPGGRADCMKLYGTPLLCEEDKPVEGQCKCGKPSVQGRVCPFDEEIDGIVTTCNCCDACHDACCDRI